MSSERKLVEEPLENPDSARFLCEASELAYRPEAEGTRAYAERLGREFAKSALPSESYCAYT